MMKLSIGEWDRAVLDQTWGLYGFTIINSGDQRIPSGAIRLFCASFGDNEPRTYSFVNELALDVGTRTFVKGKINRWGSRMIKIAYYESRDEILFPIDEYFIDGTFKMRKSKDSTEWKNVYTAFRS